MTDFEVDLGTYLDGNALAGTFAEVFTVDVTTCATRCATCGRNAQVAQLRVYASGAGSVARCAGCNEVVARIVRTDDAVWLDLRGTAALRIPMPPDA